VFKQGVNDVLCHAGVGQSCVCSSDPSAVCTETHQLLGHVPNYRNSMVCYFTTQWEQQKGTPNAFCKISTIYNNKEVFGEHSLQTKLIRRQSIALLPPQ